MLGILSGCPRIMKTLPFIHKLLHCNYLHVFNLKLFLKISSNRKSAQFLIRRIILAADRDNVLYIRDG